MPPRLCNTYVVIALFSWVALLSQLIIFFRTSDLLESSRVVQSQIRKFTEQIESVKAQRAVTEPPPQKCECTPQSQLVFDFGMNNGGDTEFFLTSGYDVIAVEANPKLAVTVGSKFQRSISAKKLRILNVGITQNGDSEVPFYVHKTHDEWSSFVQIMGCRNATQNGWSSDECDVVQLPTMSCVQVLNQSHVNPTYVKVDIEGLDRTCIQALHSLPHIRPRYFSVEATDIALLHQLHEVGYKDFKIVCQALFEGNSGPFGENAIDIDKVLKWRDYETVKAQWPSLKTRKYRGMGCWWDLHARWPDA